MKRLEEEDHKLKQKEILASHRVISDDVVERDPNVLQAHPINKVLYGEEKVDNKLVLSILEKGQLEPIIITEDNIIISGHKRWLALKKINEKGKKLRKLKDKNNSKIDYANDVFVELKARCVIAQFNHHGEDKEQKEIDEILAIIDYNKRRPKRYSQYYNEIKELRKIYDGDAKRKMIKNLKQYADVPDLSHRYGSDKSNLQKAEEINKLIDRGTISAEEIIKGKNFQSALKKVSVRTVKKIEDNIGLCKTNIQKLTKIGDLAKEVGDEKAVKIMKYLDNSTLKLNNAHNIFRLREIQTKYKDDEDLYNKIEKEINDVLEPRKVKDKKKQKTKVIADQTVNDYKEIVKEKFEDNPKFNIILIEPDNNFNSFTFNKLQANVSSVLLIIANNKNLAACINLMSKLDYAYKSYYNLLDQLLLLGTKNYNEPKGELENLKDRNEIYSKIKQLYPKEKHFHEVPNKKISENHPEGWEIPIKTVVSNKKAQNAITSVKSNTKSSRSTTKASAKPTNKSKGNTKASSKTATKPRNR